MAGVKNMKKKKKKSQSRTAKSKKAALFERREGLFKKARELSILCEADVAVIIISADGIINEFASSSMQDIITRYRKALQSGNNPALNPEEPDKDAHEEANVVQESVEKQKLMNILGKDLECMNTAELVMFEKKLNEGMRCIEGKKLQLFREWQESIMKANPSFPIYSAMPLSVQFPGNREFVQSTSYGDGPQIENSFRDADRASLPSTSYAPLPADDTFLELTLAPTRRTGETDATLVQSR